MRQTTKPVSKSKVLLLWLLLICNLVFWVGLVTWYHLNDASPAPSQEPSEKIFRLIFMLTIAGFCLVAGTVAYTVVIFSNCFTLNFRQPVFSAFKGKLYLAKIVVPIPLVVGLSLILALFLEPLTRRLGLSGQVAFLVPLFAAIIFTQVAQVWIDIWMPVTKRLIAKRLVAQGILPAQLQDAVLVGISDPLRSSFKKLTLVEDDIGALWIGGAQLIYRGDTDQFAIAPQDILQLERRGDAGSTSMLSGTSHVILHVRLPEGSTRQILFHTEGKWTLGRERRAMDDLHAAITDWHVTAQPAVPPPVAAT